MAEKNGKRLKKARTEAKTPQERKKESIDRKKNSGLRRVELWLDELTIQKLDELCIRHGYEPSENGIRTDNDARSNVVGYCIRKAAKCRGIELPGPLSVRKGRQKHIQEVHRLYQVVKHRRSQADSTRQIAQFMEKSRYTPPPRIFSRRPANVQRTTWTSEMIEELEDEASVLHSLEIHRIGFTSSKTSSKR